MAFWNQIKRNVGNAAANAEDDLKNKLASKLYGTAQTQTASKQTTSELDRQIEAAWEEAANPTPFSYDASKDATARKLESVYRNEARRASEDVLGQYAAMTGGRPSSAAVTAAATAGSDVSTKLAEALAARESEAYSRYWDEQNNTYNKLAALLRMKEYEDSRADAQWEKDYNREVLDFEKQSHEDSMKKSEEDAANETNTTTKDTVAQYMADYGDWITGIAEEYGLTPNVLAGGDVPSKTVKLLMDRFKQAYPSDAYDRMFALIQYMYDNGNITEAQYGQLLEDSGLLEIIESMAGEEEGGGT